MLIVIKSLQIQRWLFLWIGCVS